MFDQLLAIDDWRRRRSVREGPVAYVLASSEVKERRA
jgi:hypothetical protein